MSAVERAASGTPRRSAVLVTGASTGIGEATALRLARRGTVVFAGVRTSADAERLARDGGALLRPLLLDVCDGEAIARARAAVEADETVRLDGLVNNAGIAVAGPLEILPLDELRRQFEVNFFGAIAATQAFLPLLRANRGRLIFVSSIGGKFAAPFVGAYSASKFAIEAVGDALRLELRPFGVRVVLIEPGAVRTPIWSRSAGASLTTMDSLPPEVRAPYEAMISKMVRVSQQMERQGVVADAAAQAIERALDARRPRARYLVGRDARFRLVLTKLPESLRDAIVAKALGIDRAPAAT